MGAAARHAAAHRPRRQQDGGPPSGSGEAASTPCPAGSARRAAAVGPVTVGALAVVNAIGDVRDADGRILAGSRAGDDVDAFPDVAPFEGEGDATLLVVATDARLAKVDAALVAPSANHGIAQAVHPSHTRPRRRPSRSSWPRGAVDAHLDRLRLAATEVSGIGGAGTRSARAMIDGWASSTPRRPGAPSPSSPRTAATCTKCPLAEQRTQVVFGVGDEHADLVFVGEGPGAEEDRQGIPFVGRAGQLLARLIEGIGLRRDDVYICNVVKCRPPGNRDPLPAEIEACRPYLDAQLDFLAPRVVVTLGNFATRLLLDTKEGITKLRGREQPYREGGVLIPRCTRPRCCATAAPRWRRPAPTSCS